MGVVKTTPPRRTYWHLEGLKHKPSDYEIVTSRLLYHPQKGFETRVPVAAWYQRYQQGSPLQCADWERFRDPRETTYTKYTTLQHESEMFVDGLFRATGQNGYDTHLTPEWLAALERVLPTLRYLVHGLQMAAAYVAQMAPSGRIVITAMMQSADEIRRVQRFAYRMRMLQLSHPGFGDQARTVWERDPAWQGLRELIEHLLVSYDWGEALIALNFAVKPVFDELIMRHFATLARSCGDDRLESLLSALNDDCRWHRQWSVALLKTACADRTQNRELAERWFETWLAPALAAAATLTPALLPVGSQVDAGEWMRSIEGACRENIAACWTG